MRFPWLASPYSDALNIFIGRYRPNRVALQCSACATLTAKTKPEKGQEAKSREKGKRQRAEKRAKNKDKAREEWKLDSFTLAYSFDLLYRRPKRY